MPHLIKKPEIRFLLDENVSVKISSYLKDKGFDVSRVPSGLKNGQVISLSVREKRILLTHDTDFSDPILYPGEKIFSIIIFRIHPPEYLKLSLSLDLFLEKLADYIGKRFLLFEDGYTQME